MPDVKPLDKLVFLPRPRRIVPDAGVLPVGVVHTVMGNPATPGMARIARQLQESVQQNAHTTWAFRAADGQQGRSGIASLALDPDGVAPSQGYRIEISPDSLRLAAHDPSGLFYGVMTLVQILRQTGGHFPQGIIEDAPDFAVRGVMVDVSRDKVPSMETLFAMVDRFAGWKINHLELYTEHTFAYFRHRDVWAEASPMTGEEIRRLDEYCRDRFIELVPNQNSFGHMARWLTVPAYRDLAECPDGFDYPWGTRSELPNSLNPADPRSLTLVAGLYDELLPNFTSRKFNVGCDETWDLGQGKCKALCQQLGKGRVYLDFLLKLYKLVKAHGHTMHFWGDIIIKHPELVAELPKDVVVLEWGYEADHPFAEHGEKFAASGIPFYVCPGTSSWNSFAGRTDNCLANLLNAAENGIKHGATGFLNTDWGDCGHLQYLPASYLGFAAGAALAWCVESNKAQNWRDVLNVLVFQDSAGVMGGLAYDLGNAYLKSGHLMANASILFRIVLMPEGEIKIPETVTEATLADTIGWIDGVMSRLSRARMACPDAGLVADEFANTARMLRHACLRGALFRCGTLAQAENRLRLAADINLILGEHQSLWLARNRVGGLKDSVRNLEQRLKEYEA